METTIRYLHARGVRRIYLAGLSNGAVGASRLAATLAPQLAGLILISGGDSEVATAQLPLLIIQGRDDTRMPTPLLRSIAAAVGARGTYIELDGDHFVLVKARVALRESLATWLLRHERGR